MLSAIGERGRKARARPVAPTGSSSLAPLKSENRTMMRNLLAPSAARLPGPRRDADRRVRLPRRREARQRRQGPRRRAEPLRTGRLGDRRQGAVPVQGTAPRPDALVRGADAAVARFAAPGELSPGHGRDRHDRGRCPCGCAQAAPVDFRRGGLGTVVRGRRSARGGGAGDRRRPGASGRRPAGHDQRSHLPARGRGRPGPSRPARARSSPPRSAPPASAPGSIRASSCSLPTASASPRTTTPTAPIPSSGSPFPPTAPIASASRTACAAAARPTSTASPSPLARTSTKSSPLAARPGRG